MVKCFNAQQDKKTCIFIYLIAFDVQKFAAKSKRPNNLHRLKNKTVSSICSVPKCEKTKNCTLKPCQQNPKATNPTEECA